MKKNYESGKDTSPIPKKLLLVMKLTAFLIILFSVQVTATVYSQNKKLTIDVQGSSIKEVLQKIEAQSEYRFIYENEKVNLDTKVSLRVKDEVVEKILKQLFDKDGISFSITENNLILINPAEKRMNGLGRETSEQQPQKTVSGKVAEQSGVPIPGATVLVKGTNNGTITDVNGSYTLSNVPANATLVFSFVGMKSQDVLLAGKSTIDVVLREDAIGIEEVVAIGYGTAKKKDLTGAVGRVDIEESRMAPNTNASQILRGTTAGVQVTDNGRPGSSGSIVIRGRNSISGSNDPLIVLDGIIYAGGSLSDINPGDIESIDILKDASSAAIYGSLAANGVIEITTKRGKEGKPKITFNSYIGSSDFAHIPDYLNAEQYLAARKDYEAAVGGSVPFQPTETANIEAGRTIDPFKEIKQAAPIANYELSASGKADRVTYFFSGSYSDISSPVKGDNFKRLSSRLNVSVQATDWLKVGINSGYSSRDDSGVRASLLHATYLSPYGSLFLDDGVSPRPLPMDLGMVSNPILGNTLNQRLSITNVLFTNGYLDVNIWKGISYKLNTGYTRTDSKLFTYNPSYEPLHRLGSGSKRHGENQNITVENILKYSHTFNLKHKLDLTLMYGIYEYKNQYSLMSSQNIFNDALGYNALEIGDSFNIDSGASANKQNSSMSRLGYSFKDRYYLTLSLRRDGYSAFGEGRKYGIFPAVALSWNVSEEDFMKSLEYIDFLKLRASWGRNGNRGVSAYSSLSQVDQHNYVFGDGGGTSVGLSISSFANPNLGWETTESLNIGADVRLLKDRINTSVNFYSSNTYDLLLNQTIPNTNGFETFLRNIGKTRNHGLEVDLSTINIKKSGFEWESKIAFSFNRNKIVKLTGRDLNNDGKEDDDIASGWFIGKPLGSNFDYVMDGVFQVGDDLSLISGAKPGDLRFKDINGPNGVPDGKITPDDRTVIGSSQPDFILGLTNIFRYKGFSLSSTFNTRQGGQSSISSLNPGTNFADQVNFLDVPYWTPENPINTAARIDYKNPLGYGFYQSRSFVRLQDVSVSYEFPSAYVKRVGISALQIYVSGKNLATWTKWKGWDPEFGSGGRDPGNNGPLLKTYTLGLNISL
jgi:TonB-linked SusC/RagA family outer membrane protein